MNKTVRLTLTAILVLTLLTAVFVIASCDNSGIDELRVENAKISFMRGDEFELGDEFAVYADYKDGTSVDVTAEVEIRQENGMDMNVAGDYQITVIYGEKRTIYTVYVNDSADILRKIELDTSSVKKQYLLGDSLTLDGIELTLTYENSRGIQFTSKTNSLVGFNVSAAGSNGSVNGIFTYMGTFTVTVAQGNVKASFDVTVDGVNISTVQGALAVGGFYDYRIASGNILTQGARLHYDEESTLKPGEPFVSGEYEFKLGNNYTYFKEIYANPSMAYHCSVDSEGFFVAYLENDVLKPSNLNNASMMEGAPIYLWYSGETEYGAVNALNNLYSHAQKCSNGDLQETADETTRTYSFSFSGLEFRDSNADYYETTVTFTLGGDYAVNYVKIEQLYYENNSSLSEQPGYVPTFTTDPDTGKTTPCDDYSHKTIITVTQTSGDRTADNKYSRDMFNVSSYDLEYEGETVTEEDVIQLNAGGVYKFTMSNIQPSTANLALDVVVFDFEGNTGRSDTWISNEHFSLIRSGKEISVSARHGGTWTIYLRTAKTEKKLTVNVIGEAPADMQPKLLNTVSGKFYDGEEKTVSIGGAIYFYGEVNQYANDAQTATITSENGECVTLTKETVNGVKCWKFIATQEGTYQVTVVSDVAALTRCIFTFTVSETVDLAELLDGEYSVQDKAGDIYRVTFTVTDEANLSGTVVVTRTPTDLDDNPLTDQTVSQTLEWRVDGTEIIVTHSKDDAIWVEFAVDEDNNLELIDQRDDRYILNR